MIISAVDHIGKIFFQRLWSPPNVVGFRKTFQPIPLPPVLISLHENTEKILKNV